MDKTPRAADEIVTFGEAGGASILRYNLPLPGRVTGRRLVQLDVGLAPGDFIPVNATNDPIARRLNLQNVGGERFKYDVAQAVTYLQEQIERVIDPMNTPWRAASQQFADRAANENRALVDHLADLGSQAKFDEYLQAIAPLSPWASNRQLGQALPTILGRIFELYRIFRTQLESGGIPTLQRTSQGAYDMVPRGGASGTPALYLIETYGISTFLGDYGLGRTLATFSLLPGEETKIYVKTWRTDTATSKESTSIVDSYTSEAAQSHKQDVQDETTTKSAQADKVSWHVEAEVSASWGWGSAKISGGAAGDHQTSRESFARGMQAATEEHAFKASSNRSNTVTAERTATTTTGFEQSTERTIKNINLRRVLNFVFRELNQDYITKIHLISVKVAFSNGPGGVWDEVAVPQLRELLDRRLVAGPKFDPAAQALLKAIAISMDATGNPVKCLEKVTSMTDGSTSLSEAVPDASGNLPVPPSSGAWMYRFKPGPLSQTGAFTVDGVLVKSMNVTMRTESIVCEALLGQADALDPYAIAQQFEDAEAKRLDNKRTALVLDTLAEIEDPEKRAAAYAAIFNPPAPLAAK
jgi:hypothetical protein